MPSKLFTRLYITNTNWNHILTGVSGKDTTLSVYVTNHNNVDMKIDMALIPSTVSAVNDQTDVFLWKKFVYGEDSREFKPVLVPENTSLYIRSDTPNYTVLCVGFEDDN